ncbi:hypothetical protein [Thalassospira sp.]|uniref:hypothetical protein n=1 Tax=Thalassospira sp. TaxID=1912094 RepID=UPI003AA97BEB
MRSALRRNLTGCALSLTVLLAAAVSAQAANDPCPPLIPPLDMQKIMTDPDLTDTERLKLLQNSGRDIREPATWSGCHTVIDKIDIHAAVKIEPGTVLKFSENAGLDINRGGSLDAKGTADKPVVFTAEDEIKGYWYGLYFESNSSKNRLIHSQISYAGGGQKGGSGRAMKRAIGDSAPPTRAVMIHEGASVRIENTHIEHAKGYGIEALGTLQAFSHNQIDHTDIPARLQPDDVGMIDADSTFSDNTKDQIDIIGLGALNKDASWVNPGIPYVWHYNTTVAANLELQPGVEILMAPEASMSIDHNGSLKAIGTAENPIVIHGVSSLSGSWDGIFIRSKSDKNVWKYVRIADGGGGNYKANIYDGGYLDISNSRVENSRKIGILVNKNSGIDGRISITNVKYKDNEIDYKEEK